jgi:hypothetical protein
MPSADIVIPAPTLTVFVMLLTALTTALGFVFRLYERSVEARLREITAAYEGRLSDLRADRDNWQAVAMGGLPVLEQAQQATATATRAAESALRRVR